MPTLVGINIGYSIPVRLIESSVKVIKVHHSTDQATKWG